MNTPMNSAVRKIHNLLSSGAVTVTGPNQPRILKQKVGSTTVSSSNSLQQSSNANRCYVCDDALNSGQAQHSLTDMQTSHTSTKFPNKIGQLVGEAYMVIVSVEDVVCSRCTNLINYLDRLENDVERVRSNLMNLLHKKYGLNDEGGGSVSPPIKMQKLNSGAATRTLDETSEVNRHRKLQHTTTAASDTSLGKQTPPVSAVQQIKISTHPPQQQTTAAGTQTLQRKTTKIYKCLSCDYKTSDMRLFNTHYESCKQQNFQCKNCKKIFPNFGAMKQHMVREHNTAMDHTCAICHINFVNDTALRKHMELNHSTSVVVTSTTTLPVAAAAPALESTSVTSTSLYTCNHCQFKSTDKVLFDEHMRKHMSGGVKPKPFKCRVCAQRFETREAATIHAKQHQPNYFKCGTCSMSFPKREQLVKHFEVHSSDAAPTTTTVTVKQTPHSQNLLTTQKLLQDTINEALSESVNISTSSGSTTTTNSVLSDVNSAATGANNIRFFSCHICSLTFIQENYYNQHMETHRPDKKIGVGSGHASTIGGGGTTISNTTSLSTLNNAAQALLSESLSSVDVGVKSGGNNAAARHLHSSNNTSSGAANSSISEADIESIFEKMHSDKGDTVATSADHTITTDTVLDTSGTQGSDNLVITSQEGTGGISFNITIPQPDTDTQRSQRSTATPVSVSIDMPMLDQPDEASASHTSTSAKGDQPDENDASKATGAGPVSMPSLDDDNDTQEEAPSTTETERDVASENTTDSANVSNEQTNINRTDSEEPKAADDEQKMVATDTSGNEGEQQHSDTGGEADEQHHHEGGSSEEGHVAMELDEAMQAHVEGGQIKFILNENGQLLQLDNHIITDADGNQILVQDSEQIQQLLQSVGVLQSGEGLDGETLQMMTDANGQMVLVQGENNETQLIDASLLNADGQLVIQQGQDGELGEGAHVIGEDGTRIPVSVSYTADGQPIVQRQVMENVVGDHDLEKDASATDGEDHGDADATGGSGRDGGGFFALEDLMQHSTVEVKADE